MLMGIWRILAGGTEFAAVEVNKLHMRLVFGTMILIGLVLVQWGVNSVGMKGLNYVPFFVGGFLLLAMGFTPIRGLGTGAVIGTVFAALKDQDLTQGAAKGILWWAKAVIGLVFVWWVISGALATWSFEENPWAFWPVAAMACVLVATTMVYGWKSGVFPWIVVAYAIVVMGAALYSTISPEKMEVIAEIFSSEEVTEPAPTQWSADPIKTYTVTIGADAVRVPIPEWRCVTLSPFSRLNVSFSGSKTNSEYMEATSKSGQPLTVTVREYTVPHEKCS